MSDPPPSDVVPPPIQPPPDKETPPTTQLPLATNPPPHTQSSSVIIKDQGSGDHLPDPPSSACSSLSGSVTSLASGKSGIPKPSGIKPPSKISRPCAGIDKKPALPASPTKINSSDDSIRRLTDDYGRHRLTDVLEEESEEESFGHYSYRKKYYSIGSTGSSMDALWELHPRRLSEAGLSRHSDSSAVLTEDTDSFIIGQRVWVSGTKPGHIAFIGETQFAPGEWAGIALDEPIGKNDGSVGGIRYFQCEAKKGVFARLTRLTRFPLAQEGMGSGDTYVSSPSPVGNGIRRSPVSPTGSTRGLLRSPGAIGGSNTSITSGTSHVIDYKLGDRVIIKSSQGSKVGTVKYMGTTEFANGEWVGVELDDPRGKNDGSVNGIRYFECRPNFGLFAPVSKVSKSPSKVKPNACQVHSGTGAGLPPTGIRKVNSKESLFSNRSLISNMSMTSASAPRVRLGVNSLTPKKSAPKTTSTPLPARTAMQDLLKEKQQHIEQLLKERDIERSEITKAASEAEETERKLTALRAEYDKYRSETEVTLQEHMNMFSQLKEDRNRLVSQLDEEKRKVEDLHFRLAETSISNEDIEKKFLAQDVANVGHIKRIKELEEQLAKERDKTDELERDANKLFEAEEKLMKTKVEIESLRKQVQDATNRQLSLEDDSVSTTVLVASLHKEIDQYKSDLDKRNEMISILKEEISKINSETKKQVEEAVTKKTELETLCTAKDEELTRLKQSLDNVNKLLQEKVTELETIANEKLNSDAALEKEINRLKMDISAKVLNLENIAENTKAKEETIATLMNEMQSLKDQLEKKSVEKEELKVELLKQIVDKDSLIEQLNTSSHKQLEEIRMLKEEMEKMKQSSETSIDELKEKFNKSIENSSNQFNTLKLEFDQKNDELFKSLENYNSLKIDFENFKKQTDEIINQKNLELSKNLEDYNNLKIELENLKKKNDQLNNQRNDELTKSSENYNNLKTEFQNFKKETEDIIIQKNVELAKSIENCNDLKISFENLKKQSDELITQKNIELNNLAESLKEKDDLIQSLQLDLQTTKIDLESVSANLKQYHTNLGDVETNLKKERDEIKETLKAKIIEMEEAKKQLSEEVSDKVIQLQQLTASFGQKSEEADKLIKEINSLKENHDTVVRDLNDQHSKEIIEKDKKLGELRNAIEVKTKECDDAVNRTSEIEEQCRNKASEIVKLREDLENRQTENRLKSEDVSKLNENLTELEQIKINLEIKNDLLEKTVNDLENNLGKQVEDISAKTNELQRIMNTVKEKDEQILSLQAEISSTKEALNKSAEDLKRYQSSLSDTEITLKKQMVDLQAMLDVKNQEIETIKTEMNVKVSESETRLNETNINLGLKNDEIEKLKNQIIDIKIDHEKYIREVTDRFKGGYGEMEEKISDLLTELETKNSDICNLNKNILDLKNTVSETNINMEKLKKEFEASQQQNVSGDEHLTKLQEDVKKLKEAKEDVLKLLQNSQELADKVSTEKDKLRNEVELLSSKTKESDEILRNTTKQLEENQQALLTTKTDYEKKVESLEAAIKKLEQAVKDQEVDFNKQKLEYEDIIKTAYESEEALKDLLTSNKDPEKIHELEKNLEGIKSNLDARDKLLSERNNEISKLREELKKAKSQQISNGSVDTVRPNPVQINQNPDYQQLLEEKISAESQVSFLNSIIVDMQKKNEEQKARIEILEMGYSASAADELVALGFKSEAKTPAPRMYCDICEEFDLHETEDCPTQGEDEQPLVNPHLEGTPKHKPPPRPYCDICGEFGHATEDCTVDHEF